MLNSEAPLCWAPIVLAGVRRSSPTVAMDLLAAASTIDQIRSRQRCEGDLWPTRGDGRRRQAIWEFLGLSLSKTLKNRILFESVCSSTTISSLYLANDRFRSTTTNTTKWDHVLDHSVPLCFSRKIYIECMCLSRLRIIRSSFKIHNCRL